MKSSTDLFEMQRYLSLSKRIEQLMNNAEDENDPCVPVELMAEFFVLQEELYQKALKKNKEERRKYQI